MPQPRGACHKEKPGVCWRTPPRECGREKVNFPRRNTGTESPAPPKRSSSPKRRATLATFGTTTRSDPDVRQLPCGPLSGQLPPSPAIAPPYRNATNNFKPFALPYPPLSRRVEQREKKVLLGRGKENVQVFHRYFFVPFGSHRKFRTPCHCGAQR